MKSNRKNYRKKKLGMKWNRMRKTLGIFALIAILFGSVWPNGTLAEMAAYASNVSGNEMLVDADESDALDDESQSVTGTDTSAGQSSSEDAGVQDGNDEGQSADSGNSSDAAQDADDSQTDGESAGEEGMPAEGEDGNETDEENLKSTSGNDLNEDADPEEEQGSEDVTLAEQYLDSITALLEEAQALDSDAENVSVQCADIYDRLMDVYAEALADKEAGNLTEEEYGEIYDLVGETVGVLYGLGYDPYAVTTLANSTSGTSDHLEVKVTGTATVTINGKDYPQKVSITTSDTFKVSAKQGTSSYTGFTWKDATVSNGVATGGSVSTGNGSQDRSRTVKLNGSFQTGTKDNQIVYTITVIKDVTFTVDDYDGDGNSDSLTIPMELSVDIGYWYEANNCPGTYEVVNENNRESAWTQGYYVENRGSGIDVAVSGSTVGSALMKGKLAIAKSATGVDSGASFQFVVKDSSGAYLTFDSSNAYTGTSATLADSCYITVTAGSSVVLSKIPVGVYTITEIQKEGYIITDAEGNASDNYTVDYVVETKTDNAIPVATFTNKKLTTDAGISIKKTAGGLASGSYPDPVVSIYTADANGNKTSETAVWSGTLETNGDTLYLKTTLAAGTYVIEETGYEEDGYNCTTTLTGGATVNGLVFTVDAGKRYDLVVNNQYSERPKTTSITLTKEVTGNMGDRTKEFSFNISVKNADGSACSDFTVDGETVNTASLSHGETVTIGNLPIGGSITITENNEGYTTSYKVTNGESTTNAAAGTAITETIDEGDSITFINHKEMTIDTGVILDTLPYVLILAIVIAGIIFGIWNKRKHMDFD